MVSALICSGQLSLPAWEPYVQKESHHCPKCGATKTRRFMGNARIRVAALYVPLVLVALSGWKTSAFVSGARHDSVVGSLLHDSPISGLLWTSSAPVMASVRTWKCNGGKNGKLFGSITEND